MFLSQNSLPDFLHTIKTPGACFQPETRVVGEREVQGKIQRDCYVFRAQALDVVQ